MPSKKVTKSKNPQPSLVGVKKKPKRKHTKIRGANSSTYLHKLLSGEPLTQNDKDELGLLVKSTHRITPVSKSKAKKTGTSVFNAQTGYHEWIPTDLAFNIANRADPVWTGLYTVLRSPTWLLILNPSEYCINFQEYYKQIELVIGYIKAGNDQTINASQLGLVGHSGGLNNLGGTQLTTYQSDWHDKLREIFKDNCEMNDYVTYWLGLQDFLESHFLFYNNLSIPCPPNDTVSIEDIMKQINWDLNISGRGNPPNMNTLYDIAQYLRAEWEISMQVLSNGFNAYQ